MIFGAMLLLLMVTSCREESDAVQNYVFNDGLAFNEAKESYAGKFKVLWKALDQNYAIWDYERSQGVDWDAVYDEYLPKYEALDELDDVTDDDLKKLLEETVAPLHDGHFVAQMQNHKTGGFVMVSPSHLRRMQRDDYESSQHITHNMSAYLPVAAGGNGDIMEYKEVNTQAIYQVVRAYRTSGIGYQWAKAQLATPTALQPYEIEGLQSFVSDFDFLMAMVVGGKISYANAVQQYNQMAVIYQYLKIPGVYQIEDALNNYGITVQYALFKNNVAYLYFDSFGLSPYVDDEAFQEVFGNVDVAAKQLAQQVRDIWKTWFDKVQALHVSGQLKGVIIDLRGNGGGMLNDFQYVLGSMLPSGGFEVGMSRFKRGLGRYDYSPLVPFKAQTLEADHETITEPIVVLANCGSVSMAEMTTMSCQSLTNGFFIGKRTHGGLCALNKDPGIYYQNYAGIVGEQDKTPVFLYIPHMVTMSKENQIFEGVGLTPDIEVDFDVTLFQSTGRDSQLERALQFMNTQN